MLKRGGRPVGKMNQNRYQYRVAKKFGDRKLSTISKKEVAQFHASLREELSPASSNRILVLLSAVFKKAVDWEITPSNPCSGVKQFPERNARTRFLDESEIAAFLAACDAEENRTAADLLKGLLLCGLRKSELKDARWADVNLDRGELRLHKNKKWRQPCRAAFRRHEGPHRQPPQPGNSEWLFPGRDGKKPLINADKPFQRIIERAGLAGTGFTIHCIRHTFASWMAINGYSLVIIGQMLGHRSQAMSARYSHLNDNVMRAAGNTVGQVISQARLAAAQENPSTQQATA